MQQILHLDLDVEYELPAVEEFAQRGLRVELSWNIDVDLLGDLLKFNYPILFH